MDDFYRECQEKLQNATDSAAIIGELMSISLQDLPKLQLCKFVEQVVTLLSATFQTTACPTQESLAKFQAIHQQLERALNFMEQIMEAEKQFPGVPKVSDDYWV